MTENIQTAETNTTHIAPIDELSQDDVQNSVSPHSTLSHIKKTRFSSLFKHHEFWNPRVFEIPYYIYLTIQCCLNGIGPRSIARANYNLDHGEIGIGSKFDSQIAFNPEYFLPTILLKEHLSLDEKKDSIHAFIKEHGYPVILKSDVGCVGKGIVKIDSVDDIDEKTPLLMGDYILQKFTTKKYECGIFYIRQNGVPKITGINEKHFPTVIGNGKDSILTLAKNQERYSHHWHSFLQKIDTNRVPTKGEKIILSFIGSHTLGCKFTDDSHLLTPELEQAMFKVFEDQPGFNFGRVDIKSDSQEALQRGEFVVIEVNGVASLPTHMFDPKLSLIQAYKIFFKHAKYLAQIGREHRKKPMQLMSAWDVIKKANSNQSMLNKVHRKLKE